MSHFSLRDLFWLTLVWGCAWRVRYSLRTLLIVILLGGSVCADDENLARFKRGMIPKVGKFVTLEGTLAMAKLGPALKTKEGALVQLKVKGGRRFPLDESEVEEKVAISVTGKLGFNEEVLPPKTRLPVSGIQEHFWIDMSDDATTFKLRAKRTREF